MGKWRNHVLFGPKLGRWLLLHVAIACPKVVAALAGITTAVNGVETQFNGLLVEVEQKRGDGWCHQKESLIFFYSISLQKLNPGACYIALCL